MFNFIKKILSSKKKLTSLKVEFYPLSPAVLNEGVLPIACLDCKGNKFYEGPTGGVSVNIKCAECDSWYVVHPFTTKLTEEDRIHYVRKNIN